MTVTNQAIFFFCDCQRVTVTLFPNSVSETHKQMILKTCMLLKRQKPGACFCCSRLSRFFPCSMPNPIRDILQGRVLVYLVCLFCLVGRFGRFGLFCLLCLFCLFLFSLGGFGADTYHVVGFTHLDIVGEIKCLNPRDKTW